MDFSAAQGLLNSFPIHWFILGGFFVIIVLDSLRSGTARATALAVALPFAAFLSTLIPITAFIKDQAFIAQGRGPIVLFVALFVIIYMLMRRMGLEHFESGRGEPIQSLLAATAVSSVLILTWVHTPSLNALWSLGEPFTGLFAEPYRLFWLLGAFLGLAFARG